MAALKELVLWFCLFVLRQSFSISCGCPDTLTVNQAGLHLRDSSARCAPPAASKEFCFHVFAKCFWFSCILEYWTQSLRLAWQALYCWPVSLVLYLWVLKWIIVNFGSSDEMTLAFEFHYAFSQCHFNHNLSEIILF